MSLVLNVCLDDIQVNFETGTFGVKKLGLKTKSKENFVKTCEATILT